MNVKYKKCEFTAFIFDHENLCLLLIIFIVHNLVAKYIIRSEKEQERERERERARSLCIYFKMFINSNCYFGLEH